LIDSLPLKAVNHEISAPNYRCRETEFGEKKISFPMKEHFVAVVTMKSLLESGVHFGHQVKRWDPRMKKYIFAERNGIHIIDLQKTMASIKEAYEAVRKVTSAGKSVLFVGTKKQAQQKIDESDKNRSGFHKSFFDIDIADPTHFHFVLNTGLIGADEGGALIADFVKSHISSERDALGAEKIKTLLAAQHLVNTLVFTHKVNIEFLHAVIDGKTIVLQGVADSSAVVEQAVALSKKEMPGYDVKSCVSIVQDFKAHPK